MSFLVITITTLHILLYDCISIAIAANSCKTLRYSTRLAQYTVRICNSTANARKLLLALLSAYEPVLNKKVYSEPYKVLLCVSSQMQYTSKVNWEYIVTFDKKNNLTEQLVISKLKLLANIISERMPVPNVIWVNNYGMLIGNDCYNLPVTIIEPIVKKGNFKVFVNAHKSGCPDTGVCKPKAAIPMLCGATYLVTPSRKEECVLKVDRTPIVKIAPYEIENETVNDTSLPQQLVVESVVNATINYITGLTMLFANIATNEKNDNIDAGMLKSLGSEFKVSYSKDKGITIESCGKNFNAIITLNVPGKKNLGKYIYVSNGTRRVTEVLYNGQCKSKVSKLDTEQHKN